MRNKGLIVFISILFLLSTTAAILGFIESKKEKEIITPTETKETVSYEYYLEDVLQSNIPTNTNTEDKDYLFNKYQCTNNINGSFNEDEWKFIPGEEKEGICKLYFVKTSYDITITAANGSVDENNPQTIAREGDGKFIVTPNEGYKFKEVNCSNDKKATYDEKNNTLNISVIMEDIACKINFEIRELRADFTVKNGEGTTTEIANYAESISILVKPNEGYENPKISCTNKQEATFENNRLTIDKLTDDTKCTIEFVKVKPTTYNLSFEELSDDTKEKLQITSGSTDPVKISTDGSYTLTIKSNEGYENYKPKVVCSNNTIVANPSEDGTYTYTITGITKDTTCVITAQESSN